MTPMYMVPVTNELFQNGNVEWTGTPLAPLLEECGPLKRGIEVVFFGADEKIEKIREKDYLQNFAAACTSTLGAT
jgi:DMSO/TMAO reductase YedYZ molybdopterin-dependent catalytic subunit